MSSFSGNMHTLSDPTNSTGDPSGRSSGVSTSSKSKLMMFRTSKRSSSGRDLKGTGRNRSADQSGGFPVLPDNEHRQPPATGNHNGMMNHPATRRPLRLDDDEQQLHHPQIRSAEESPLGYSVAGDVQHVQRENSPMPPFAAGEKNRPGANSEKISLSDMRAPSPPTPQSTKVKTRARSISPHARHILRVAANFRTRSRSRSRSRSQSRGGGDDDSDSGSSIASDSSSRPTIVAVTSCRSDAYHAQKAPGATSKLPRKAPTALKSFHELAVGCKDAYEAVGAMPRPPDVEEHEGVHENGGDATTKPIMSQEEREGRQTLWEFMGNLDFLLALVDEVALDSATRGALKDDTRFKSLRDVIKKCNKVLEAMVVRRERKFTLFFRLVQPLDTKEIKKMRSWNARVEKAVGAVADARSQDATLTNSALRTTPDGTGDFGSDAMSNASSHTAKSSDSSRSNSLMSRGRSILPSAGRVRGRRATPTPSLRNQGIEDSPSVAAEDGFSAVTTPVTSGNLDKLQRSLSDGDPGTMGTVEVTPGVPPSLQQRNSAHTLPTGQGTPIQPKDELVDVIRGLKEEKDIKIKEGVMGSSPAELRPNWVPKADIPSAVPRLPTEYIHRHRLMKQVVNCLLDRSANDEEVISNTNITSITSRHSDKAGNGKTTLAVAAIQTVEVRERFSDGIAWLQLGRTPLTEKDVRRLYEELYRQLLVDAPPENEEEMEDVASNPNGGGTIPDSMSSDSEEREFTGEDSFSARNSLETNLLAKRRRRFQGGELEGMKEDLGHILTKRRVLICLDDVWRVEDAKWFIFPTQTDYDLEGDAEKQQANEFCPFRVLITTRSPLLLGPGAAQEVFVRIFSEHEAVKLLLASAGRRVSGGKNSPVFSQARVIVKGCGNSPLAVRLAGGILRCSNRNWTLSSPSWTLLVEQCSKSLEEASKIRSFVNSVGRVVDLSFVSVGDLALRTALRQCFVVFAMAFRENDWVKIGKGIPRPVVLSLFETVLGKTALGDKSDQDSVDSTLWKISPGLILEMLETMNMMEKARHGAKRYYDYSRVEGPDVESPLLIDEESNAVDLSQHDSSQIHWSSISDDVGSLEMPSYLMHASIKYIAEEMAMRPSLGFAPNVDDFTAFASQLEAELSQTSMSETSSWSAFRSSLEYLAAQFTVGRSGSKNKGMEDHQFHELIVSSLTGVPVSGDMRSLPSALAEKKPLGNDTDSEMTEKYVVAYLPTHLIRAKLLSSAGDILTDSGFIGRRVATLGPVEATRRQVVDLADLRREASRMSNGSVNGNQSKSMVSSRTIDPSVSTSYDNITSPKEGDLSRLRSEDHDGDVGDLATNKSSVFTNNDSALDINSIQREGSRLVIDKVYRIVAELSSSGASLNMAICLSSVGEGLLKAKQPREAMLRLEEAVGIYRNLLGPYHIDVARALHSVAKALVKLGEMRVALLKFGEAARIFEACNATRHYDAIVNAQTMANLMIDDGKWDEAELKYEDVIALRRSVYGRNSLPVAKTINDHAVVLAKHGRMDDALHQYEAARRTYHNAAVEAEASTVFSGMTTTDLVAKCKLDMTLISLNIASIKSRQGDIEGAVASYEEGVAGLTSHMNQQAEGQFGDDIDASKLASHKRHLVAAYGRIGSLKLKLGNNEGALEAYASLLREVDSNDPASSRMEKAKAHVKCATIYRQRDNGDDNVHAILHLQQALDMYTKLYGSNHKDTQAIASSLQQWKAQDAAAGSY